MSLFYVIYDRLPRIIQAPTMFHSCDFVSQKRPRLALLLGIDFVSQTMRIASSP